MCNHACQPFIKTKSLWGRILSHPLPNTGAACALLLGMLMIYIGVSGNNRLSDLLTYTPTPLDVVVGGCLVTAGSCILIGLHWTGSVISSAWQIERFGWILASGGFGAVFAATLYTPHGAATVGTFALTSCVGSALHAYSLLRTERGTRFQIVQHEKGEL